jgi:integrase
MSNATNPVSRRTRKVTAERRRAGVVVRHSRRCESRVQGRCSCSPSYQAQVWSTGERKPIRKTFATIDEARAWRQESQVALRKGTLRAPSPTTLSETAEQWLAAAEAGVIRTRSGDRYKPSALRSYRQALETKILPTLGHLRLTAVTTNMLQDIADRLAADGLSASTIRNSLLPLRAIYRRALNRSEVATNPTLKLTLPTVRGRRDHIARPEHAAALIAALPLSERALWATAFYAGLRLGELQALDWTNIDLDDNLIHVERSWDRMTGFVNPKSRSGRRRVPITDALRRHLLNHRLQQGKGGQGFVFPSHRGGRPCNPSTIKLRSTTAWTTAELEPITLHECRHSYAAYMIAAGVNTKALSTY